MGLSRRVFKSIHFGTHKQKWKYDVSAAGAMFLLRHRFLEADTNRAAPRG
jgi:predicted RNA-binding protein with PUA domain